MPDNADAVSGATETPALEAVQPSSDDTQASEEQEAPAEPVEKPDYRKLHKEDPDLNAYIQQQIDRAVAKRERAQLRARAQQITDAQDKDAALDVARYVAASEDEDENSSSSFGPDWQRKADKVQSHFDRIAGLDDNGMAHNEWYIRVHQKYGQPEMDKRYQADPEAFVNWVDDEIQELKLDARLKKVAPSLAEAMATDQVNRQLARAGAPLAGGAGAGGALSLEAYDSMSYEQRQELRRKNPKAIDDMVARYSR